jgi:hypothetical protein
LFRLETAAPIGLVRRGDLEHLDAGRLEVAQQPRAVGSGRLDADAVEPPERAHPGQHLPVALSGRGEAAAVDQPVMLIDDRGDMEILMRVDAADNAARGWCFVNGHDASPACPGCRVG